MDFRDMYLAQHAHFHTAAVGRIERSDQDRLLNDLSEEQLRRRPHPKLNSMVWLVWHMTRVEDVAVSLVIAQRPQVLDDGWVDRLKIPLRDIATGMSDEEVDNFSEGIDLQALLAYRAAVGRQTQEVVRHLPLEALDETVDSDLIERLVETGVFGNNAGWVARLWRGRSKGMVLMQSVLAHTLMHVGQCEDTRAMLGARTL